MTNTDIIILAIPAAEGVLSFLSAVLPKASKEENIVNSLLDFIHTIGLNFTKVR